MSDQLVVVIIDDRAHDSRYLTMETKEYFKFYEVTGIDDVAAQISRITQSPRPIVDIILCDVNMERDDSAGKFTIMDRGTSIDVEPKFAMTFADGEHLGGEGKPDFDRSHDFRPYGPILALPFTRFFSGGGVTEPISAFWNDARLIRRGEAGENSAAEMNGYAYVALRLIWDQHDDDHRGPEDEKFADRLSEACSTVGSGLGNVLMERLKRATAKRRAQLFERATLVEGLTGATARGLLGKEGAEPVTFWDDRQLARQLKRSSLFGDFAIRMQAIRLKGEDGLRFIQHEEDELADEIAKAPTHPDPKRIRELCESYVDVLSKEEPPTDFEGLYLTALDESGGEDATLPPAHAPRDLPSYLRRYLLLTAQLYLASLKIDDPSRFQPETGGKQDRSGRSLNVPTRKALGLDHESSHEPKDFIYGRRLTAEQAVAASNADPWLKPFWPRIDGAKEADGWQGFNIRRTPEKGEHLDWTPLDRSIGQAVWKRLNQPDPCLYGLGGPTII
jgi:hypothetical protein